MIITAGSTDKSVYFYAVQDNGGTEPGEPATGLVFSDIETGGSASYARQGAARTDFTLVTLGSASAAHTDGGFIEVDGTTMPGVYRCDVPDAAFASGVDFVLVDLVAAPANNVIITPLKVDIIDVNLRDTVRAGLTALPNAGAGSAGGVPTDTDANGAVRIVDGTGARELNTNSGAVALVDAVTSVNGLATDTITAAALATDAVNEIRDAVLPTSNATLSNIPFVFKDSTGVYVTGATGITLTRSIDGGAFGAVSGSTVSEVGNGLYEIDASAADMNGGKITFRVQATGGTPGAPADAFVTIVTNTGV